ncbi:MAG: amidohydrolase family protein [Chloroflexi bacterium]|nr:amidohydrolase family protein [Chloroflexota bacterium]MDA1297726.1 amidohydrolase family protein [Chloroflexota bacterium]
MSQRFDLVLRGGHVADPANNVDGVRDIGFRLGKIAEVADRIDDSLADDVIDVSGKIVMPGHIDTHAHLSGPFDQSGIRAFGHVMLAESGTTTALDLAGEPVALSEGMKNKGAGMNVATLLGLVPHTTVREDDPSLPLMREVVSGALRRGAIGVKLLGGYYPFTPESTSNVIAAANEQMAWVAFHIGSKDSGSDLTGLREVPEIVGGGRLHIAHVNSYCRGLVLDNLAECNEAFEIIESKRSQFVTEAYLAQINGTNGKCDEDGNLVYNVAQNCLKARGYPTTDAGMRQALLDGYGGALVERGGRVIIVTGEEAVRAWEDQSTDASLSFPVNPATSAFTLATAKYDDGEFRVDAVSTDGGSLPRNVAIERTMALVNFGALSLLEAATKLSYTPSRMLGLLNKGHLSEGADGDVTVIDRQTGKATMSLVDGAPIMINGRVVGSGGTWLVTGDGEKAAKSSGLPYEIIDLEQSRLYAGWR